MSQRLFAIDTSFCPAQSGASLTANQGVAGSSPGLATYFRGDLS